MHLNTLHTHTHHAPHTHTTTHHRHHHTHTQTHLDVCNQVPLRPPLFHRPLCHQGSQHLFIPHITHHCTQLIHHTRCPLLPSLWFSMFPTPLYFRTQLGDTGTLSDHHWWGGWGVGGVWSVVYGHSNGGGEPWTRGGGGVWGGGIVGGVGCKIHQVLMLLCVRECVCESW